MRRAVIVIGANYGDEGKGLTAAWSAERLGGRCLDVLINGGAQRGHTVDLPDGRRHVFHHFGAAAFIGADSCADADFIVNPMMYWDEAEALAAEFGIAPALYVSDDCRVSTPWDMMLNQIIEENRGAARHGSCGCGILETRLRYENTDWALGWGALAEIGQADYRAYCRRIAEEYLPERLRTLGMAAGEGWTTVLNSPGIIENSWADLRAMVENTRRYADWAAMAADYETLVFEAGQGLGLDEDNRADFPHRTPSHTTSLQSARRIAALPGETDAEVLYVTRSYLTRHGAGPLPTECPKAAINPDMEDLTNVPNPHQQTLRYGRFDAGTVLGRTWADLVASRKVLPALRGCVLITHLNETGSALAGDMDLAAFAARFDAAWRSDGPCMVTEL